MDSHRQQMDRILGGNIRSLHEQELPGLVRTPGASEVVYFADDGALALEDQMYRHLSRVAPSMPKSGGVHATKHTLRLPTGELFHAIKYRGDVAGWQTQIQEGAKLLGVVLGTIEEGWVFALSDGRRIALSDTHHGFV